MCPRHLMSEDVVVQRYGKKGGAVVEWGKGRGEGGGKNEASGVIKH